MKREVPWAIWSPTKLGLLLTCPLAFFFKYVINLEPAPNIFGAFGEAIHQMVRKFFSLKNGFESEKTFIGAWKHYWWEEVLYKKHAQLFGEVGREKCEKFFAIGINILRPFYRDNIKFRRQGLMPLVEKTIDRQFRGHRLLVRLDRIQPLPNRKRDIVEYKTGLRKADRQKLINDIQFTFYNLLYRLKYGEDPETMWLYYLSHKETVPVPLRKESDYLKLTRLLDEATTYVKNILRPSYSFPAELSLSGLDPEDIKKRRFSDHQSSFCNICNYERFCRGFQPNDSMREEWVQREIERMGFPKGIEQSVLSLKEVKNETARVVLT